MNHEVLLDAGLADAGKKLGVITGARGDFADVEGARLQLVERIIRIPAAPSGVADPAVSVFFEVAGFGRVVVLAMGQGPCHTGPG